MIKLIAAATAIALAASASAQVGQPTPPNVATPTTDPMNPAGAPRGMEAHENAGNLSTRDEIERLKRQKELEERNDSSGAGGSAAAASDIVAGSEVRDKRGKVVGTVETVDADGAVVATAAGKVKVPLDAFGKNRKGLLIGITKAEFDAAVAEAVAQPAG